MWNWLKGLLGNYQGRQFTKPLTPIVEKPTLKDDCGNESTISQNIVIEIADDFTITHVDSVDTVTCFSMVEYASITLP